MNTTLPTVEQLKKAVDIKTQIDNLESELANLFKPAVVDRAEPAMVNQDTKPKRHLSRAAKAKIASAMKARWERIHQAEAVAGK